MKRIGILGGTFNPIHIGHLILAERAREEYSLDEVMIMPSGVSYLKADENVLDADTRMKMAVLAARGNPYFSVCDMEIRRAGNSYTSDTLKILRAENPEYEYYYIIGADTLYSMDSWKAPADIFSSCHILAAVRNNSSIDELNKKIREYKEKYNASIDILSTTDIDISSRMIRGLVHDGHSIRYYVPDEVNNYIMEHGLYK